MIVRKLRRLSNKVTKRDFFTIGEIARIIGATLKGNSDAVLAGISTDSRSISPGQLFVPLTGENFNGHDFIQAVAAKGAAASLAESDWSTPVTLPQNFIILRVADTLRALGDIAAAQRKRHHPKMFAITGSNGKTTTKEMLASILAGIGAGLKTEGNLNNLVGLPGMLFRLNSQHRWCVLEMGMSKPGEIDRLAEISFPEIGVVLNVFPAHLESMGNVENVAKAKGELLLRIPDGGVAVVNADDPLVSALPSPKGVERVTFGIDSGDIRASDISPPGVAGQTFTLDLHGDRHKIAMKTYGRHTVYSALAAAAAAFAAGTPPEIICAGLENFVLFDRRFCLEELNGVFLVDDSYNANPGSMKAALSAIGELKGSRRALVALGDMLEMGGNERKMHHALGIEAASVANRLYLYGELSSETARGALEAGMNSEDLIMGGSHAEIADHILADIEDGDFILVKGSRGMKMDKVAQRIRERKGRG